MIEPRPITPAEMLLVLATLLGSFGIIVTVFTSLRAVKTEIRSNGFDTMATRMLDLDRLFIERPELRDYFYDGKPPPSDVDPDARELRPRLDAAAEYLLDLFDSYLLAEDQKRPIFPVNWWGDYMRFVFEHSPLLRSTVVERRNWYAKVPDFAREIGIGSGN